MNTVSLNTPKKKKLIELPVDVLKKLGVQAALQGKSLKKFIENIVISQADAVTINGIENPSPSGDDWFNDSQNISIVMEGIKEYESGKTIPLSMEEIDKKLGI